MEALKIQKELLRYFSAQPEVETAYLFGSAARGELGPLSDIDLAILIDEEKVPQNISYAYKARLITGLMKALQTDRVDLVILNESPLLLRFEVLRGGKILYVRDERKRIKFEVKVMSLYLDELYYFKRHARVNLERIARKRGMDLSNGISLGPVSSVVERGTENPCVGGSIPSPASLQFQI